MVIAMPRTLYPTKDLVPLLQEAIGLPGRAGQVQKMYTICQLQGICEVVVGGVTGRDWTDQVLHCVQEKSVWGKLE
jgi:hypothetical protein